MTSHIVNRKLDQEGNPGTLSAKILDGILRKRLKFNGVIFTDDMQMHAITKHYGLEDAIKLAVNGGVDIMTFSNNIQGSDERTVDKVHSIIKEFVKKGVIKKERIDESFTRIMKLKRRLEQENQNIYYQQALEKSNRELEAARQELASQQAAFDKQLQAQDESKKKKKKRKAKS
jgi:beta-N-acetylhexosaminidase